MARARTAAELARELGYGDFLAGYRHPQNGTFAFSAAVFAYIVAGAGILPAAWTVSPDLWDGSLWQAVLSWVLAAAVFGLAAWLVVLAVRVRRGRMLHLYSGGLVVTGVLGRPVWWAGWADTEVRMNSYHIQEEAADFGIRQYYKVVDAAGRKAKFNYRIGRTDLGDRVRELSAAARTPLAHERFRAGEPLTFGPFRLDQAGLTHRAPITGRVTTYPWPVITGATVDVARGVVFVLTAEKTAKGREVRLGSPVSSVPDLSVLLALVESHRAASAR